MYKHQLASPASPFQSIMLNDRLAHQLDCLSLASKKSSYTETVQDKDNACMNLNCNSDMYMSMDMDVGIFGNPKKSKLITKNKRNTTPHKHTHEDKLKHSSISPADKRKNTIRKMKMLQSRINQLQRQINSLRRNCQNCINCHPEKLCSGMVLDDVQMIRHQELTKNKPDQHNCNANNYHYDFDHRNSRESVEFQAIDFAQSLACKPELDDRAWIMIGVMMITIGSKNLDIDGTINTFRLLNDCVDSVRRQVEKSVQKINLDFYFMKQQMKESHANFIEGLDFNPFYQKNQGYKAGFQLESLKLQSAELFQLVYDEKINFSINYQSLIAMVQHLKENCWVSL